MRKVCFEGLVLPEKPRSIHQMWPLFPVSSWEHQPLWRCCPGEDVVNKIKGAYHFFPPFQLLLLLLFLLLFYFLLLFLLFLSMWITDRINSLIFCWDSRLIRVWYACRYIYTSCTAIASQRNGDIRPTFVRHMVPQSRPGLQRSIPTSVCPSRNPSVHLFVYLYFYRAHASKWVSAFV